MTLAAILSSVAVLAAQAEPAPPPGGTPITPIHASKIILVGDSTTAVIGGWGPASAPTTSRPSSPA